MSSPPGRGIQTCQRWRQPESRILHSQQKWIAIRTFSPSIVTRSGSSCKITSPASKSLYDISFPSPITPFCWLQQKANKHCYCCAKGTWWQYTPYRGLPVIPEQIPRQSLCTPLAHIPIVKILILYRKTKVVRSVTFLCSGQVAAMHDLHWTREHDIITFNTFIEYNKFWGPPGPNFLFAALRAPLTSSIGPFGRSGRVTQNLMHMLTCVHLCQMGVK